MPPGGLIASNTSGLPITGLGASLRVLLPDTLLSVVLLEVVFAALLLGMARMMGINFRFIREELAIVKGFLKK